MRNGLVVAAVAGLILAACAAGPNEAAQTSTATAQAGEAQAPSTTSSEPPSTTSSEPSSTAALPTTAIQEPVTVLAVADMADCRPPAAEVAELIDSLEGTILIAGDLAYPDATQQDFDDCFFPLYEDDLPRILSAIGDNEYNTPGAAPYFAAMKDQPGETGKGWYAVELGAWQVIVLNSNCSEIGGCGTESEQYLWLDATLKEKKYECRLAMWHMPRFTSSPNYRGLDALSAMYGRLHGAGTDVLIVGHSHHYERFDPLAPNGQPAEGGITNFTVGVGGGPLTGFGEPRPGSAMRADKNRGVLQLTLWPDSFDWEFINTPSSAEQEEGPLIDSGSLSC